MTARNVTRTHARNVAHAFFIDSSKNSMTKDTLYVIDVQAKVGHSGRMDVFSDVEFRAAATQTGAY